MHLPPLLYASMFHELIQAMALGHSALLDLKYIILEIKECTDIIIFKKKLKTYLFKKHELELIFNSQRSMILGS